MRRLNTLALVSLFFSIAFAIAGAAGAVPYSDVVLSDSPVSYWRLGDAGGPAVDEVGGRDLTYEGNPLPGQQGGILGDPDNATGFAGDRSALSVVSDPGLESPLFSIEAWAKVTGPCENSLECFQFLASHRDSSGYTFFYVDNGNLGAVREWGIGFLGPSRVSVRAAAGAIGEWSHVVGSYDGSELRLFINGQLAGATTASFAPGSARFTLGRNNSSDPRYSFDGVLDEVAYYDYALSTDRVAAHYQAGIGVIPEPSTALLMGLGLAGLASRRR